MPRILTCCAVACSWLALGCGSETAPRPPNIVLIVFDDLRADQLGDATGGGASTPHIDRLAAEGTRFTQFYATGAACTPGRAGLLTGRSPSAFGMAFSLRVPSRHGLPPGVPTLASVLSGAGYATGHFGKWHLGSRPGPRELGFQRAVLLSRGYRDPVVVVDDGPHERASGHMTDLTTDHVIEFMRAHRHQPFLMNVWYRTPHYPYEPPPRWASRQPETPSGRFAAMLGHGDEQVGRILSELDALGLDAHTLVLVTSDNGASRARGPGDAGLRGGKFRLFEGGIRVPFVARWPGTIPAAGETDALALGFDLLPTFAELAGLAAPQETDGRSLAPALLGGQLAPDGRTVFWEQRPPDAHPGRHFAARRGPWKLVRHHDVAKGAPQLFEITGDPGETTDLAQREPATAAELEGAYRDWRLRTGRVPHAVTGLAGAARRLVPDGPLRLDHGDLGFRVSVTPRRLGAKQVIAAHPDSWNLRIGPDGRLHLSVRERKGSGRSRLASRDALVAGRRADVAFSICGRDDAETQLRLYLDGVLQAQSAELRRVRVSEQAVWLGAAPDGSAPLQGVLDAPVFLSRCLGADDVAALAD